jgi:SagB-type dehydrogenase family enzyme
VTPRRREYEPAELFHLNSSNVRSQPGDLELDHDHHPPRFRRIAGARRIALPKGHFEVRQTLGAAFRHRQSTRDFALRPLALGRLSQLLFLSHGVRGTKTIEGESAFDRCSPSAGGLYPIELYVVTQRVGKLPDGIYHYDARFHMLEEVRRGRFHDRLADLTIGQDMIRSANLVLVLTATFDRTMWKYGLRGYRYVWLDAGHVGENVYLAAGGLGLGAVTIGGFFDAEVNALLELPREETAVYLACVGQRRPGRVGPRR